MKTLKEERAEKTALIKRAENVIEGLEIKLEELSKSHQQLDEAARVISKLIEFIDYMTELHE